MATYPHIIPNLCGCLCATQKLFCNNKKKSYRFGTTWRAVNDDRIYIFGWTIPVLLQVCVHCCECALGWVKCRGQIPSMGHHTWPHTTSPFPPLSLKCKKLTQSLDLAISQQVFCLKRSIFVVNGAFMFSPEVPAWFGQHVALLKCWC